MKRFLYGCAWWAIVAGMAAPAPAAEDDLSAFEQGSVTQDIRTADGVLLSLTYWQPKGMERVWPEKDTPAVILLHRFDHNQRDWYPFAKKLYDDGFFVVTYDIRGHGESRTVNEDDFKRRNPRIRVDNERVSAKDFRSGADFLSLDEDIEAIKMFLIRQNNLGVLNIRRLGIVAAGDISCLVALHWVAGREFKYVTSGFSQQGGDLRALVLISPTMGSKGIKAATNLGDDGKLPIMIVSGAGRTAASDAGRVASSLRVAAKDAKKPKSDSYLREESVWMKVDLGKLGAKKESEAQLLAEEFGKNKELSEARNDVANYLRFRLGEKREILWEKRDEDFVREPMGGS